MLNDIILTVILIMLLLVAVIGIWNLPNKPTNKNDVFKCTEYMNEIIFIETISYRFVKNDKK